MIINREKLLHAIEATSPGFSSRDVIEQSSSVVFKDGMIVTFNDEIACMYPSPFKDAVTGAVPKEPLEKLLRKLTEEELEVHQENGHLTVKGSGSRRAQIAMEDQIVLPLEHLERPTKWKKLPDKFCEAIEFVKECASRDEAMFSLTCIHIHPEWVESFNDYQLARYNMRTGFQQEILVRQNALNHISSLGMVHVCECENWIHFRNMNKLVLSCRRYVDEYPSLTSIVEKSRGTEININASLVQASERAEIFSSTNAENNQVSVYLKPGQVKITGKGHAGKYTEIKKSSYKGDRFGFMISPKMLQRLVRRNDPCEITEKTIRMGNEVSCYIASLTELDEKTASRPAAEEKEAPKAKRKRA